MRASFFFQIPPEIMRASINCLPIHYLYHPFSPTPTPGRNDNLCKIVCWWSPSEPPWPRSQHYTLIPVLATNVVGFYPSSCQQTIRVWSAGMLVVLGQTTQNACLGSRGGVAPLPPPQRGCHLAAEPAAASQAAAAAAAAVARVAE